MKPGPKPDATVLEAWRLLCLQAKVLEGEISTAREDQARQGSKGRVAVLTQAQMARRRVLRALRSLVP